MSLNAIPTVYRGRNYRSRLEARYAAWFDALAWPYEYEPIDLAGRRRGYIPDFLLAFAAPLLVEVKPYTLPFNAEALATCRRIVEAWDGNALLVGASHIVTEDERTDPEIRIDDDGMLPIIERANAAGLFDEGTIEIGRMYIARERYWNAAYLAHDGSHWYIGSVGDPCTHLDGAHFAKAQWSWSEAGNAAQWNPRGRINNP